MIRQLLTTGALLALFASGAYAQNAANPPANAAAAPRALVTIAAGYTLKTGDLLATKVIGEPVYDSTASDAKEIGRVKDLVITPPSDIVAAVLGVGGFLGVAQKNVAVDFTAIKWSPAADGTQRMVLNTTKDELLAAPEFIFPDNAKATAAPANQAAAANTNANADQGGPAVDVSKLKPVDIAAIKAADLKGADILDPQGHKIASINDFVLTPDGKVDAVVVDFGGFLGIGSKQVAVAYEGLKFLNDDNNKLYLQVNVTKDQLKAARAYNKDDYAANRDAERLVIK